MKALYRIGIDDKNMEIILEQYPKIMEMNERKIEEKILILKNLECNERHIRNIIISNPYYLDRDNLDILKLIKKLTELGIDTLNILFDSYPYILNKDDSEIDEYIEKQLSKNKDFEDIIDELVSEPYLIDEI